MNDAKTIGSNALVLDTAEENVTVMNAEESELGKEVSLILFRNGYSVQPVKQKKDGRSNEYLVKYWIGETMVEGAEIPK